MLLGVSYLLVWAKNSFTSCKSNLISVVNPLIAWLSWVPHLLDLEDRSGDRRRVLCTCNAINLIRTDNLV